MIQNFEAALDTCKRVGKVGKKSHFRAVVNMDIAYMKTRGDFNSSGDGIVSFDFISENPEISIPYLILISMFTLNGSIGNFLVIASVLSYKVSI